MSIGSFISKLNPFAAKVVNAAETFGLNELDKAIAAAKKTTLGAAVVSAIAAAESATGSTAKLAAALAAVEPAVVSYLAKGGVSAVEADVTQFATSLIESTLADLKATKAVSIARSILAILGIK